jgi:hypothetical protein
MNISHRKNLSYGVLTAFLSVATGWCQETLPARMPERAAWKITYAFPDESGIGTASRFAIYFPKTIAVEKSGGTIHETITYRSGKTQERWIQGPREAMRALGGDAVVAVDFGGEPPPPDHFTFQNTDFQDLKWLGPQTFRGTGTYQGRRVLVFVSPNTQVKTVEPLPPNQVPALPVPFGKTRDRVAALDAKTFQPLYFYEGGCARTYEYSAPSVEPLVPPPEFARVLSRMTSQE